MDKFIVPFMELYLSINVELKGSQVTQVEASGELFFLF